jgi:hypothetical protein
MKTGMTRRRRWYVPTRGVLIGTPIGLVVVALMYLSSERQEGQKANVSRWVNPAMFSEERLTNCPYVRDPVIIVRSGASFGNPGVILGDQEPYNVDDFNRLSESKTVFEQPELYERFLVAAKYGMNWTWGIDSAVPFPQSKGFFKDSSRPPTVVLLEWGIRVVGYYRSDGAGRAFQRSCHVVIADMSIPAVIYRTNFYGGPPPKFSRGVNAPPNQYGSAPTKEIADFLKQLRRR